MDLVECFRLQAPAVERLVIERGWMQQKAALWKHAVGEKKSQSCTRTGK
jgi:hypothetical protein